jgi:hypothetical protein
MNGGRHLKLTVVLLHRHVAALDRLAVTIRLRSGIVLSRATIIDALIAASMQKPGDLVGQILQRRMSASQTRVQEKNEPSRNHLAKS